MSHIKRRNFGQSSTRVMWFKTNRMDMLILSVKQWKSCFVCFFFSATAGRHYSNINTNEADVNNMSGLFQEYQEGNLGNKNNG